MTSVVANPNKTVFLMKNTKYNKKDQCNHFHLIHSWSGILVQTFKKFQLRCNSVGYVLLISKPCNSFTLMKLCLYTKHQSRLYSFRTGDRLKHPIWLYIHTYRHKRESNALSRMWFLVHLKTKQHVCKCWKKSFNLLLGTLLRGGGNTQQEVDEER